MIGDNENVANLCAILVTVPLRKLNCCHYLSNVNSAEWPVSAGKYTLCCVCKFASCTEGEEPQGSKKKPRAEESVTGPFLGENLCWR